ncbi:signal recognition particle protein [Mycoplasma todarodis]|uniref:Signal recognition particle protein n=1 Tax=Mycoplasma todarodis TaxID=1937191 RepID=A0A4R0XK01_9MOLU|nr:signal recognition particle protein [Mycoplasma todarodis]TCG10963.1 signal recognition particle protein [Mycoplasma todarodis]
MLNILGNRLQKSMKKMQAKTSLKEEDILEVTREIKMALLEADVNLLVVKQFVKSVKKKALSETVLAQLNPGQNVVKIVKDELTDILGGTSKEVKLKGNLPIIMMVGLQGSGKTTTTGKLVNHFKKKKASKNPLLVAGDVYRPAAVEQLKTLGKQLGVTVFEKGTSAKPQDIVEEAMAFAKENEHDLIIIDTAGRLSIDEALMEELVDIKKIAKPQEIFYVADALSGQDIINVASTFHERLSLTGSIITKLDSDARGGAALSITKMLNLPIVFIGTSEKMSGLDQFHPDRMAERILGMGDVLSLIEKAQDVLDEDKSTRMANRMANGHFDLDDLLEQLQQMKKLGKLGSILKMIPGAQNISKDKIEAADRKQKLFEILISSMTKKERKNPKLLKNAKRKQRIIAGSGRTAQEYNSLVNEFERMAKQMKQMAKAMKDGTFNPGMMRGMGGM